MEGAPASAKEMTADCALCGNALLYNLGTGRGAILIDECAICDDCCQRIVTRMAKRSFGTEALGEIGIVSDRVDCEEDAARVKGVGKDAATVMNEAGGKQSDTPYAARLLPPFALLAVAEVLHKSGLKYGDWNWLKIPVQDHVNRVLVHALAFLAGDESDDHLTNMTCRALFALEQFIDPQAPAGTEWGRKPRP